MEPSTTALVTARRHDLDALRGFAMLLGVVLHANMSFLPGIKPIWGVEDICSSASHTLLGHVIHGWRMQLFFFISGFFTMMLWRKRGSKSLIVHRAKRIFLPLILAMVTITPCWWIAQDYVRGNDAKQISDRVIVAPQTVVQGSSSEEKYLVSTLVQDESNIDPWQAVFVDDAISLDNYLNRGGDKNLTDPTSGSTLLHAACFYGKSSVASLLIDAKADLASKNRDGLTPKDLLASDWATTQFIASLSGVEVEQEQVDAGRRMISELLDELRENKITENGRSDSIRSDIEIDVFLATIADDSAKVKAYLESGGDPNQIDPENGSTPLHAACFFGKANAARELIFGGANLYAKNNDGQIPQELLYADLGTTQFIAGMLMIEIDAEDLNDGRMKIASIISKKTGDSINLPDLSKQSGDAAQLIGLLFFLPFFNHLWFLWFLSWFVIFSVFIFELANAAGLFKASPKWIQTPWRFVILIPMTAIPQYFMARMPDSFGPDTSIGFIPLPTVFIYYAMFFLFGAMYFSNDVQVRPRRAGVTTLLILSVLIFFFGHSLISPKSEADRVIFSLLQSAYAWLMTFGMMGIFTYCFSKERGWVRYLSDSSYWLYLVHLPVVLLLQDAIVTWAAPSFFKLITVTIAATGILLLSYHAFVRSTWIGVLLNGRRYTRTIPKIEVVD